MQQKDQLQQLLLVPEGDRVSLLVNAGLGSHRHQVSCQVFLPVPRKATSLPLGGALSPSLRSLTIDLTRAFQALRASA